MPLGEYPQEAHRSLHEFSNSLSKRMGDSPFVVILLITTKGLSPTCGPKAGYELDLLVELELDEPVVLEESDVPVPVLEELELLDELLLEESDEP